jgi:vacuolar protein sorting-associated protein 13A/C
VFGAASGLTRLVGDATGGLAMDGEFAQRRKKAQQMRAEDAGHGLALGVKALRQGLCEGAKGVLAKPLQGAMDDGARGFVKGLGQGLLGVAAKPLSGVASLVSKTAEGIASDANDLTARGRRAAALRMRVRQPRLIGSDGVLKPYPKMPGGDPKQGEQSGGSGRGGRKSGEQSGGQGGDESGGQGGGQGGGQDEG